MLIIYNIFLSLCILVKNDISKVYKKYTSLLPVINENGGKNMIKIRIKRISKRLKILTNLMSDKI